MNRFMEKTVKEKILILLPYFISCFVCSRIAELCRLCGGNIIKILNNVEYLYKSVPRFTLNDLLIGITAGYLIVWYIIFENRLHRKNMRRGEEYGGAHWGTAEDIKPFIDPNPFNNIILSKTERLSMKPRMPQFNLNRNKHVVVYGGSGSGKTYCIVKSNLYQMHSSYVLTDPKGTLLPETGNLFYIKGWRIKVFDTVDLANSMHYNPFAYIRQPKDILTLANVLFTT